MSLLGWLGRQISLFHLVGLVHVRLQATFGKGCSKQLSDHWRLVGIINLIAADPFADPGLGNTLRITDCDAFVLKSQIARGRGSGIEMLMEPHVWRHDHRSNLPIVATRL